MLAPPDSDMWLGIAAGELPVAAAYEWAVRPGCGAVVLFSGTVRDHAEGRDGVQYLTYEAYDEQAVAKMSDIVNEIRTRWPSTGAVAMLHRTGRIEIGESTVVVVVSSPHRAEAFEAGRYGIDALKASVPIWKHEVWDGGSDWGTGAHVVTDAADVPRAPSSVQASPIGADAR
ncbi:MAG: molybdenum cofactor biosynthesis protein MoaE [Ilumatobacteraceae bacterium]